MNVQRDTVQIKYEQSTNEVSEKLTSYLFLRCSSTATQPCAIPAPPPRAHSHATVKVSDSRVAVFQMFACKGPELNFFSLQEELWPQEFPQVRRVLSQVDK